MSEEIFKKKTIENILKSFFRDEKTKMTNEAVLLSREVISIFIREAVLRCIREAEKEDTSSVTIEHLEKILPQLLLDF